MAKNYRYSVEVSFNKGECTHVLGVHDMPYYRARGIVKNDKVRFFKKIIKIQAERNKYHSFRDILHNPSLTLHQIIERSIMLYYANCTNFPLINRITVNMQSSDGLQNYREHTNRISTPQIFSTYVPRDSSNMIIPNTSWFNLDKKGNALRISLSYWLEAISTNVTQIKFERAWTAFNTLYSFYGKKKRETDNHAYIKSQICTHPAAFAESLALSASLNTTTAGSYRWKKWILHHAMRKDFTLLENIMTSITDDRLKNVFADCFNSGDIVSKFADTDDSARDANLQNQCRRIQTSLTTAGIQNDMEVTLMLCVNYAYFLRNRRFHGGSANSFCKISPTTEDTEFDMISTRLITLVKELYEADGRGWIVENPTP